MQLKINNNNPRSEAIKKLQWNPNLRQNYYITMNNVTFLQNESLSSDVEQLSTKVREKIKQGAEENCMLRVNNDPNKTKVQRKRKEKWYDSECKTARREVTKAL